MCRQCGKSGHLQKACRSEQKWTGVRKHKVKKVLCVGEGDQILVKEEMDQILVKEKMDQKITLCVM